MFGHVLPKMFAAAAPQATDSGDWVALVLRELARSQAGGFVVDLVKWTFVGGAAGVLLAICTCIEIFSCLGWYDLKMRFARGLRWERFSS